MTDLPDKEKDPLGHHIMAIQKLGYRPSILFRTNAEEKLSELESTHESLKRVAEELAAVTEKMHRAMQQYEMDVDGPAPHEHRKMMGECTAALQSYQQWKGK